MKLRTTDELWILDGEIGPPWFRFRDGSGALGMEPRAKHIIRIPRGTIIYVDLPENHDKKARVPVAGRGMDTLYLSAGLEDHAELLAEMGHAREQALYSQGSSEPFGTCGCSCKGCGAGEHCNDVRCYPL